MNDQLYTDNTIYTVPEGYDNVENINDENVNDENVNDENSIGNEYDEMIPRDEAMFYDVRDYNLRDYVMYDNVVNNNNVKYIFMYGLIFLILILFLIIILR